jgi:hypothetical protein
VEKGLGWEEGRLWLELKAECRGRGEFLWVRCERWDRQHACVGAWAERVGGVRRKAARSWMLGRERGRMGRSGGILLTESEV